MLPAKPKRRGGIQPPRLAEPLAPFESLPSRLDEIDRLDGVSLDRWSFACQSSRNLSIEHSVLSHVGLNATKLSGLRLVDLRLNDCDLANADWPRVFVNRAELRECRLTGLSAAEGELRDTVLDSCKADLAGFRFATFKAVRFEKCQLTEADFQGADLSGVVFKDCDLSGCEMSGTKLEGADLRGSKIDGLKISPDGIRGAILDPTQAITLIRLLGVVIKDAEAT
jgi:uncharacterized protein YjbI with pentapeptide repeats